MKEGWTYKKLGDFIQEYSVRDKGQGYPVYSVTNTRGFCQEFFGKNVASEDTSNYKVVPRGCFAYNPSRINVGSVAWQNQEDNVSVSPLYVVFSVSPELRQDYLLYFIKSNYSMTYIKALARGAVRNNLRFSVLKTFDIPYASLSEQKNVVSELDLLCDVIEKQKGQIEELDKLAQSTFYDMFGDPVANKMGWKEVNLKNVSIRFSDGPFGSNLKSSHYRDEGIRVIRLQNIGVNEFVDLDKAFITEDHYQKLIKYTCYPGDILIGTLGSPNLRACIIPQYIDKCINKADCVLCRVNNDIANAKYICYLLNCESFVKAACILSHGETRTRISAGQLRDYNIPLPPLTLQREFAAKIEAIEQMKAKVRQSLKESEELFNSRMDYYFN